MSIRRLHPALKVTRTLTGRLATSGYPILGLPKHSEEGRRIRGLVRAPRGFLIYAIDYAQIELRAAAHLSRDAGMVQAFKAGQDIHALTATRVLGAPADPAAQDESQHRLPAKAANFGYWMGLEPKGLTEQVRKAGRMDWSARCPGCRSYKQPHADDCDSVRFFAEFDRQFPGAKRYRARRIAHAHQTGFAYGMWGARWYLPGVWSPHDEIREATERQTFALPIQEGAQRLIKQAMAAVWSRDLPWARARQVRVEPILQIHDELLFCVEKSFVPAWHRRVKRTMEMATSWVVPIVAEGSAGRSWLEKERLV